MRLFALRLLDRDGRINPLRLRHEWRKLWEGTDRSLRINGASRDQFGQTSNAYKTCYWLLKNEFCLREQNDRDSYTLNGLGVEKAERMAEILRAQELLEAQKMGNPLTPFGEATLKLIQKKHETATR